MQQTVESKKGKWISDKIDVSFKFDSLRPYFAEDTEERNCYIVTVKHKGKKTSFTYGDSIADTQAGLKPKKRDLLYCIVSDFFYTEENYPTYNDFASEFGYDEDSIKGLKTYEKCLKQGEKLHNVFDENEIKKLNEELEDA